MVDSREILIEVHRMKNTLVTVALAFSSKRAAGLHPDTGAEALIRSSQGSVG